MRVTLRDPTITVTPGRPVTVELDVTNTSGAIDGLTARFVGLDGVSVVSEPALLPLFPETTGRITLRVTVPVLVPAGTHQAMIQVLSAVQPLEPEDVPLRVVVLPTPGATLSVVPPVGSGRRSASYTVICDNTGNTTLEVALAASDPERAVRTKLNPAVLTAAPGESTTSQLFVRARSHLLGGEISHAITILGSATEVEAEGQARFRQRPVIPRGARTALILGLIVAAWAAAFLFGLSKAFSSDPLTKAVPPSFYSGSRASAGGTALGLIVGSSSDALPAGAVPKSGVVEGVGGTVSGTVIAASTGTGIGRITVEGWRDGPTAPILVSSAATQSDGTYALVGILPGTYKLHYTANGFVDVWYPATTSEPTATPVQVDAMSLTSGIGATITGRPGSISGSIDTGQVPPIPVTVTVLPEQGTTSGPIGKVTTDASGHYIVSNLPTPGTYDLSFTAPGYQAGTDVEQLGGGQARIANTVRLTAGGGEIDGVVTDGANPLGGVAITANANGQTVTSATPTAGSVGHFSLTGLISPATYLLTFTKAGFGVHTVSVALGPGQIINNLTVSLVGGTGTISGTVTGPAFPGDPKNGGLGGATVTVNGGIAPVTTQTLTAGTIGSYVISGLVTPGTYTVTFSKQGYASKTIPVSLTSSGSAGAVDAALTLTVGLISGKVSCAPPPPPATNPCPATPLLAGVTVAVSDGNSTHARSTITAPTASPSPTPTSPPVNYVITGLAPGGYSVTFSLTGFTTQTVFVPLQPGQVFSLDVALSPGA